MKEDRMQSIDRRDHPRPIQRVVLALAFVGLLIWTATLVFREIDRADEKPLAQAPPEKAQPPAVAPVPQNPVVIQPPPVVVMPPEVNAKVERELVQMADNLQATLKSQREKVFKQLADIQAAKERGRAPAGKPRYGLAFAEPTPVVAAQFRLPPDQGLVVTHVLKGGAAELAGLQTHDVLLELDGVALRCDIGRFRTYLEDRNPGDAIRILALRGGAEMKLEMKAPAR